MEDLRTLLDQLEDRRLEYVMARYLVNSDAAADAAYVKVSGLKDRDARVKQAAATEILDRTVGRPSDKLDITSGGDKIVVKLVNDDTD